MKIKNANALKNSRKFRLPDGYPLKTLADDLADYLKAEHGQAVECEETADGWLLHARDAGGRFSRLVKRKTGSAVIYMTREGTDLTVGLGSPSSAKNDSKSQSQKFGFKKAASLAVNATTSLADATVSGITDFWAGFEMQTAIYAFVSQHIVAYRQNVSGAASPQADPCQSRYVEALSDVESVWIAGLLEPGESLIAWLRTPTLAESAPKCDITFYMTTQKVGLAAFSNTGLESHTPLSADQMAVTDVMGRDKVTIGDYLFRTQLHNDMLFREIAPLMAVRSWERLYEAARLNFIHGQKEKDHWAYTLAALQDVMTGGDDPLAALSHFYMAEKCAQKESQSVSFAEAAAVPRFRVLPDKLSRQTDADQLNAWADAWALSAQEKVSLAGVVQALLPESERCAHLVSSLFTNGREAFIQKSKDRPLLIMTEIGYAVNRIRIGRPQEAVEILEHQLEQLPDETLFDLLPPGNSDLTRGEGGQQLRIRILELLAQAKGALDAPHAETLRALAMRQPLVRRRLARFRDACESGDREKVDLILHLLNPEGLRETIEDPAGDQPDSVAPLTAQAIETQLRHPASRKDGVLNKMQTLIAAKKTPDHSALKAYAKRVRRDDYPEIADIIVNGARILGIQPPEAFISFGDLNLGVRAYRAKPPFILIGNEHLENKSPYYHPFPELQFILARELAHLCYGHERITSSEVWEGAFDKTMSLMEIFPVVGGYIGKLGSLGKIASQTTNVAKTVGNIQGYISQACNVASSAKKIYKKDHKADDDGSAPKTEAEARNLIGAFLEMRLTADRAGLVIGGRPKDAVRAIFKSDAQLGAHLAQAEKQGLKAFLGQTDQNDCLIHQELAVRLAALFSFYISREYAALRTAVTNESYSTET